MSYKKITANCLNFEQIGWKYYNSIKKKAVEREFSWSGLALTLSIAFFIVIACAQGLSLIYDSMELTEKREQLLDQKIYLLENPEFINIEELSNLSSLTKIFKIKIAQAKNVDVLCYCNRNSFDIIFNDSYKYDAKNFYINTIHN